MMEVANSDASAYTQVKADALAYRHKQTLAEEQNRRRRFVVFALNAFLPPVRAGGFPHGSAPAAATTPTAAAAPRNLLKLVQSLEIAQNAFGAIGSAGCRLGVFPAGNRKEKSFRSFLLLLLLLLLLQSQLR